MPINESSRVRRERWPLAFDLEGIPRNPGERTRLLEQQRDSELTEETLMAVPMRGLTKPSTNHFAVDQQQQPPVIIDINNPPHRNYNPRDPKNEFPKMLYNHDTGKVLTVNSAQEESLALTKYGFVREPAPDRNYHGAKSGLAAPMKEVGEPREEELIAQDLAEMEEQEGMESEASGESSEQEQASTPSRRRR